MNKKLLIISFLLLSVAVSSWAKKVAGEEPEEEIVEAEAGTAAEAGVPDATEAAAEGAETADATANATETKVKETGEAGEGVLVKVVEFFKKQCDDLLKMFGGEKGETAVAADGGVAAEDGAAVEANAATDVAAELAPEDAPAAPAEGKPKRKTKKAKLEEELVE